MAEGSSLDDAAIDELVGRLSLREKLAMAAGVDTWHTAPAPSIGLPSIKVTDGPSGARGGTFGAVASASFPCGAALGATWSPSLIEQVGNALAQEAKWKGASVVLAPTMNIQRHPFGGRHFECYSEDPFLTSRVAVAFITGLQRSGVAATAKHFVANDSEFERHTISSVVSERALREIYLPPFEAAVCEAKSWALMAAYNRINGVYAAEHDLLVDLVKGEWGFDGLVMSDWWGTMSTVGSATHGLDLEMPGPPVHFGAALAAAVEDGRVPMEDLNDKARRLIRLAGRVQAFDRDMPSEELAIDDPGHRALLRRVAGEAMVLLENDGTLPLDPASVGTLAVIGPLAERLSMQGGGSAYVEPHRSPSPRDAIAEASAAEVVVEPGCRIYREPPPLREGMSITVDGGEVEGARLEYFTSPDFSGKVALEQVRRRLHLIWLGDPVPGQIEGQFSARVSSRYLATESGEHRFTLVSAGRSRLLLDDQCVIENWDAWSRGTSFYGAGSTEVGASLTLEAGRAYDLVLEYQAPETPGIRGLTLGCLPPEPPDLIDRAVALAARADAVVLVVGSSAESEKEGTDRTTLDLPGDQDELIRRVAAANGRTTVVVNAASPVSMPWADQVGAVLWVWFPGQQGDEALADVLFGRADPGGRLPMTMPVRVEDCPAHATYPGEAGAVSYADDVFVGYRGYERNGTTPRYPFGHGHSYATFELGPMELSHDDVVPGRGLSVSVPVHNTGGRPGHQVVQLYVRDLESTVPRPDRELKAFAKVHLAPDDRTTVTMPLDDRAFAFWSSKQHRWIGEPGQFELLIGTSSADITERRLISCDQTKETHAP
jgi:beta-glucosidase